MLLFRIHLFLLLINYVNAFGLYKCPRKIIPTFNPLKLPAMEKIFAASVLLSAITQLVTASARSQSSDDYIVLLGPIIVLTIIWGGYKVKSRLKKRKEPAAEDASAH